MPYIPKSQKIHDKFGQQHYNTYMTWQSPDINPGENFWGIEKKKLRKHKDMTKTKLITAILQIWYHESEIRKICDTFVDSVPNRVQSFIAPQEEHIKY